jgi:hypothetical protein
MPVHDWTRVSAGTFHAFHNSWITHLQESLNAGLLPNGYYALGEQRSGDIGPDVLTLHAGADAAETRAPPAQSNDNPMIAVAERPPRVSLTLEATRDAAFYLSKRRTLVIYHSSGDRIVALIEIVSPGNKHSYHTVDDFLDKAVGAINQGYHLLVIDLFPPGGHDPRGMNNLIWEYLSAKTIPETAGRPLSVASYCAKEPVSVYIEPVAVGMPLTEMPLFLTTAHYINVPLEETYLAAWRGVPGRWRRVIELGA